MTVNEVGNYEPTDIVWVQIDVLVGLSLRHSELKPVLFLDENASEKESFPTIYPNILAEFYLYLHCSSRDIDADVIVFSKMVIQRGNSEEVDNKSRPSLHRAI